MKLQALLLASALTLTGTAFADNHHIHPANSAKTEQAASESSKKLLSDCEITVVNSTRGFVDVYGYLDNNDTVDFRMYPFDTPYYIDMFYYGYCHAGMNLNIFARKGRELVYSGFAATNSTIYVYPSFNNAVKAEVKSN